MGIQLAQGMRQKWERRIESSWQKRPTAVKEFSNLCISNNVWRLALLRPCLRCHKGPFITRGNGKLTGQEVIHSPSRDWWHKGHTRARLLLVVVVVVCGGYQAYSRLSTTHGHITDCKLDSVVYAGVCMHTCELMWTCLVWAERPTPDS